MIEKLVKKVGVGIVLAGLSAASVGISGCTKGKLYFPAGKYPNIDLLEDKRTARLIPPHNESAYTGIYLAICSSNNLKKQ